jgi:septal ring factor EnvC (AmiA/AmiB activator)
MQIFIDMIARRMQQGAMPSDGFSKSVLNRMIKRVSDAVSVVTDELQPEDTMFDREAELLDSLVDMQYVIHRITAVFKLPLEHAYSNMLVARKGTQDNDQTSKQTLQAYKSKKIRLSKNPSEAIDIQISELKNKISDLETQLSQERARREQSNGNSLLE